LPDEFLNVPTIESAITKIFQASLFGGYFLHGVFFIALLLPMTQTSIRDVRPHLGHSSENDGEIGKYSRCFFSDFIFIREDTAPPNNPSQVAN